MEDYTYTCEVQSISSIVNDLKNNMIDLNAIYQRDIVWDVEDKSMYINSVIIGVAGNNITLNTDKKGTKICMDGKQRCSSLREFTENKFPVCDIDISDKTKEYYYGPSLDNISCTDKTKINILTPELRNKFNNRKVNIVMYVNLDYNQQTEIFNRIQYGKKLTNGEIVISKIKDNLSSVNMKQYCDSKETYLKKYYKDRKNHYNFIVQLMYMLQHDVSSPITKKNTDKFLNELKPAIITDLTKKVDIIINQMFNNKLLHKSKILNLKLANSVLLVFCYKIYQKVLVLMDNPVLTDVDIGELVDVICDTDEILEFYGLSIKALSHIAVKFDEVYDKRHSVNTSITSITSNANKGANDCISDDEDQELEPEPEDEPEDEIEEEKVIVKPKVIVKHKVPTPAPVPTIASQTANKSMPKSATNTVTTKPKQKTTMVKGKSSVSAISVVKKN